MRRQKHSAKLRIGRRFYKKVSKSSLAGCPGGIFKDSKANIPTLFPDKTFLINPISSKILEISSIVIDIG